MAALLVKKQLLQFCFRAVAIRASCSTFFYYSFFLQARARADEKQGTTPSLLKNTNNKLMIEFPYIAPIRVCRGVAIKQDNLID